EPEVDRAAGGHGDTGLAPLAVFVRAGAAVVLVQHEAAVAIGGAEELEDLRLVTVQARRLVGGERDDPAAAHVQRDRLPTDRLDMGGPALVAAPRGEVVEDLSGGEPYGPSARALLEHGGDQQRVAEHEGIGRVVPRRVVLEGAEQRLHDREAV